MGRTEERLLTSLYREIVNAPLDEQRAPLPMHGAESSKSLEQKK